MTNRDISTLPGYADWLAELKVRVHRAQQRAALSVNRELVSSTGRSAAISWTDRPDSAGAPR